MEERTKEFLMTYGWAILVVAAAIGALWYFGIFSGINITPQHIDNPCCQTICEKVSNQLTCEGVYNKEVSCLLSYERFERGWMSEKFVFVIHNVSEACTPIVQAQPEVTINGSVPQ